MGINKVIYYGEVLVDMSQVTVKPETLSKGETALDASGELIIGTHECPETEPTLQQKTVTPTTAQQTVTPDSGYDGLSKVTVNAMPTTTQATPSISVNSSGLITASATQSAGYVSAGTKTGTKQLTTQAAQTITPGNSDKTIASGRYLTGTQTIKGDANLKAENIAEGVSIFGITGTHSGGGSGGGSVETCTVNIVKTAIGPSRVIYTTVGDDGQICTEGVTRPQREITVECVKGTVLALGWYQGSFSSVGDITCDGNAYAETRLGNYETGCVPIHIPPNAADTVNITMNCTPYMDN